MVKLSRKLIAPVLGVGLATLVLTGCPKKPTDVLVASAKGPIETNGKQQRSYGELEQISNGDYRTTFFDIQGGEGFIVYGIGLSKNKSLEFRYASGGDVGSQDLGNVKWERIKQEISKPNRIEFKKTPYNIDFKDWTVFPIQQNGTVVGYFLTVDEMAIVQPKNNVVSFSNSGDFSSQTGAGGGSGGSGGGDGGGGQ